MRMFIRSLWLSLAVIFIAACGGSDGGAGGSNAGNDATLSSLSLNGAALDQLFQSHQTSYTAGVGFLRSSLKVTATVTDSKATLTVNGKVVASGSESSVIALAEGSNTIAVVVTAEDGTTTQTYSIEVTRQLLASLVETKRTASDAAAGDWFGLSVAVAGDTAVVGANLEDAGGFFNTGAAYVFTRSGSSWSEQAKLVASDAAAVDRFGSSVAVSGETVVVGASHEDAGGSDAGAAYVFTRSGSSWSEQAKLVASDAEAGDLFGRSVAVSGETVVVGAWGEDAGGAGAGAAYVFTRSGGSWSEQAKLTASDAQANDQFGYSTAVSDETVVVGADAEDEGGSNAGAAYVFTRSGGSWSEQAKLTSSDTQANDRFGSYVAVSGETIVVGAWAETTSGTSAGAAYVFTRSGGSWSEQAKLMASDAEAGDRFGSSVAVSGETVVVGASHEDAGGSAAGAAYVFARSGGSWSEQAKLTASDATADDRFGFSVAVADETAVVGAYGEDAGGSDAGAAYIYQ